MSYIEKNLRPGEHIVFNTKFHRITFILPLIMNTLLYYFIDTISFWSIIVPIVLISYPVSKYIIYLTSEFAVTNVRIITKYGLIFRHTFEIPNHKIESCEIKQSIMGRILNYGTLIVGGTGASKQTLKNIANPFELRDAIHDQIEYRRTAKH